MEIISNQLPHKGANNVQSEMAKKLTHKGATTLKSFWWMGRIVGKPKNQPNAKESQKWRKSNKTQVKRKWSTQKVTRTYDYTHAWRKMGLARL